jgi:stage IV sporulation protein FB
MAFGSGILGLFGSPLLILIAIFVYIGAASEANAVQIRQVSRGRLVVRWYDYRVREARAE